MYLVIFVALLGQVDTAQSEREWLVAHLTVDLNFDEARIRDAEQKINRLSPTQVRVLVEFYKTKKQEAKALEYAKVRQMEDQKFLEQQRLSAYRQHLSREAQYQNIVRQQELELLRRANVYQNYMMYHYWPRPYTTPYGLRGYGWR